MTDAIPRAPDSGGPFIPCAHVSVNVGRATVNLYPVIDPGMATHERAHAFHINNWLRYFYDRWCDFQTLQILSFHNPKGGKVNDSTDTADLSILLPVVNGGLNTCRKNVKFVRVQLSVNFVDLVTAVNPGPTTLRIKYFIELPQTTRQMINERGNAYNLTAFHGTLDLCTLDTQAVQAKIINYTLQEGPVKLQATSFGATSA